MTETQTQAFNEFLSSWNAHQDLRARKADIAELFASRSRLDAVRLQALSTR